MEKLTLLLYLFVATTISRKDVCHEKKSPQRVCETFIIISLLVVQDYSF